VKRSEELKVLREKSEQELLIRWDEVKRKLFMVRTSGATGGEKPSPKELQACRKEIARILTILRERQLKQVLREPLL